MAAVDLSLLEPPPDAPPELLLATPEEEALCIRERQPLVPVYARLTVARGNVYGGRVDPHVQYAVDKINEATGATSFGTYPGHSPSINLAVDAFHPNRRDELADAMCNFALRNWEALAFDYMISRMRIYNPEVSPYWRNMADRGNDTQNHLDHCHFSWELSGSGILLPRAAVDFTDLDRELRELTAQLVGA